jgi:N-carbamoylputrescine amidase
VIGGERGYVGRYRKMHNPDDPHYCEKFYFAPGDLGFRVSTTPKAKIGTLISWDQWWPEAARLTALRGGELLY